VAWGAGRLPALALRLPAGHASARFECRLEFEGGDRATASWRASDLPVSASTEIEGESYVEVALAPPVRRVPFGYHRIVVEGGAQEWTTLVISAPRRAPRPGDDGIPGIGWGVFLPLHALRSERSWGAGDFTDLDRLVEWVTGLGGSAVATLPLLAAFLGESEPYEPAPFSPASRLFWNELFLDVTAVPELECSREARAILESGTLRRELARLQASDQADYRGVAAARRRVLDAVARSFFASASPRRAAFDRWVRSNPATLDYARFRARGERHRAPWQRWPSRERDGSLPASGSPSEEAARRYHAFVQWLAEEQLRAVDDGARRNGGGLIFDLPLGVHPSGYDVWRERHAFAVDASAGAPPDPFFAEGQDWGFPPLHPERVREQGYRYPIACLRHVLRPARVLRLDHVMALHRLFWVPKGLRAKDGVYVRYPAEELYAILTLEATRAGAVVAGEDLGTVPAAVRNALRRRGILRSHVLQFEANPNPAAAIRTPPPDSVASLGTHDLPPFASFWRGADIDERLARGWLTPAEARGERERRAAMRRAMIEYLRSKGWLPADAGLRPLAPQSEAVVLRACLSEFAASPAALLVVSVEDLWLETRPQNVPGTTTEFPNWRRPARYQFEAFRAKPQVVGTLKEIDRLRRHGRA
jgi:4-alpha-glucanotransferase